MGGEVQWEVEWADAEDWTNRESLGDAEAALARRCQVKWNGLADHSLRLFGGEPKGQCTAINLCACIADRLPRLGGEERCQLFAALGDLRCGGAQDRASLPCAKFAHRFESSDTASCGALHLLRRCKVGGANKVTVKRRPNLDQIRGTLPDACDKDLLRLHMGRV